MKEEKGIKRILYIFVKLMNNGYQKQSTNDNTVERCRCNIVGS